MQPSSLLQIWAAAPGAVLCCSSLSRVELMLEEAARVLLVVLGGKLWLALGKSL